ncbi:uncharacterized protein LOC122249104 isoform X3 [Penaeus japonicus]|nr:uncharacterized protein LOC122249104 isoform X3 [Penaeus japonicus]
MKISTSNVSEQDQKERTSIVELQERIARDLMDPHTQNLLKEILKQSKKTAEEKESPLKDVSPDPATVASELEELGMDLEEVGEEVDDIFGKSITRSVEDSIGNTFQENMERGKRLRQVQTSTNPSPPSRDRGHEPRPPSHGPETRYPSDWNLKTTMEDPRKLMHSSLQSSEEPASKGIPDDAKSSGSSFWVPAFDWHKGQKVKKDMNYQSGANDWEVETPYLQRKDKIEERQAGHPSLKESKHMVPPATISSSSSSSSRLPPVPATNSHLDEEAPAGRIMELNKEKVVQARPMLFPSGHSYSPSVPPPSSQTRAHSSRSTIPSPGDEAADDHEPPTQVRSKSKRQKRGKSKQRRSYDSGSDSSTEDKKTSKMQEREVKELEDPVQKLMLKKETLLKRARSLTEQKDLMMNQREDIISNHKGDKSSLNNLLQENWFLVKEMGNQITKINHMVIEVEKEVEVLKPGTQPLTRAESPQKRRSRSPSGMRYGGASRQYEHGKTPERNYKHTEAPYKSESKTYEYSEHRRSVSPAIGKHRSRSPAAGPHRTNSPIGKRQRSGSPNVSRHKSRSPNTGRHRTRSPISSGQQQRMWSPAGEYSKEYQRAPSTSRKRTSASKPDGERRQQDVYKKKEEPREEVDEGLQYPQSFVQRTYIRYCDQGMHWCKLCSIFCESIPEYVDHLLSSSHLAKCKYDRKTWLAKAPKEEKEPKPPNATALIVPVQGVEFLHSLTSYYCSLCDVFMRDKGEAVRHPESKIHTSNYKIHLVKNPMYEASLVKTKAAAYAKYSVEQARYMVEAKMKLKEKIATDEIEEKLLRQIKQKRDMVRQEREENAESSEKAEKEKSQRSESKKEKSDRREREKKTVESDSGRTHDKSESSVTQAQASESKEYKDASTRSESKKEKNSSKENITKDVKTEGEDTASADGSSKDSQDDEKKSSTPKLPLIGKMPFLKKKQQSSAPKRKESSKDTKQEIPPSNSLVLEAKMEIPLTEEEQKLEPSDNIAWAMNQENENQIEIVQDPKNLAESDYPIVNEMDVCPPAGEYTGYEDQSGEVTNQEDEEYSCLDDLNTSECMDIEDDEPAECAAAATLKALDLLSIPLPGFKSANKTPSPSDIPLPPKTDEASKNQDNCDLPLPPGEESYPVTHFEMDNDSQEIFSAASVNQDVTRDCGSGSNSQDSFPIAGLILSNQGGTDITVPPGTENVGSSDISVPLLTAEVGSDLPLPPGTESMMGPSLPLPPGTENVISTDMPLPPGTEHVMDPSLPLPPGTEDVRVACLPLPPGAEDPMSSNLPLPPGTEDVAITSLPLPPGTEDVIASDLPLPPGTEDEAHMHISSGLGVPSTKSKTIHLPDIAQKSKLGSDMTLPGTHFGAQELSSGAWSSGSNSQDGFGLPGFITGMHESTIPPPPGTEDEHGLHAAINVLPPLGNIATQFAPEKVLTASQTTTVCMSSFTAPKLGLHTQNQLWSTSSNPEGIEHTGATWPADPSAVIDMPTVARKSHIDREFTPPPPGTEMDELNKSDSHPELGEASMELSDESDEDCPPDKKESTPPPPGTESSSESMAINESKSGKSIISPLELPTRLDTTKRDTGSVIDFNGQSLDVQVSLPQRKKEESIMPAENATDSLYLGNVSTSKIGRRSCSTEDKEGEEKKKSKVKKVKGEVDVVKMQIEDKHESERQGERACPTQQSQKDSRIGKPSGKEREEVEHGKEVKQESESKGKQRKGSKRTRDSTEEPQDLQPVEEESELSGSLDLKSSTPKKSSRTEKNEKLDEEEIEHEAKRNEESSTKHRKTSKKAKDRRESVDELKPAADIEASASQEETQTYKKSSRTVRSAKKDKEENYQDVPIKEPRQRKRSTRSSSDDQPSEKGSSTPRRKSRSVKAAIPEEREEDLESVLSPQDTSENAEESEKGNSSDVEDEQETTDSETVPQQRSRAARRLVSEDQTYEAASPRKRPRKSKPSVSEEEEPPPRRSTRTTRASITE